MKSALTLSTLAVSTLFGTWASARCAPEESMFNDMIGKPGWLILNEALILPYNLSQAPNFVIPALEQTGPYNWKPIPGKTYPQGTRGTISSAILDEQDYVRYFQFRLEGGEELVIDASNVEDFDFTQCDASTLLYERSLPSRPLGKVSGIPMIPRLEARPVDFSGDWLPSSVVAKLAYLNCYAYDDGVLGSSNFYVECAPVWKDGEPSDGYDVPRTLYYENGDLTQITQTPSVDQN